MVQVLDRAQEKGDLAKIPAHIAIIMDGNGRWARARGMPRIVGHRQGTENIRRVLTASVEFGIPILTIYAFSTENWGRPPDEVRGLMTIFEQTLNRELPELHKNGVQLRHIGKLQELAPQLQASVRNAIELTRNNDRIILNIAWNYGGRAEIVDAVRRIMSDGIPADQVTEEVISRHLYTGGLPDPDLVIRTGGEMRLSNYLIWQAAYAEYYSTPTFWPDFDRDELYRALVAFNQRQRRFGKLENR
ncbi:MAG: isoprenyl transferase [Anaerolineae bacterium]